MEPIQATLAGQDIVPPDADQQPDFVVVGQRLIPIPDAIRTEFKDAFDRAFDLYEADRDPEQGNSAPQECWPSTHEFRNILFKAGEHEGAAAARYLDRIPDPGLRLLAQIELAPALAGLPQLGGQTISPGSRERHSDVTRAGRPAAPLPPAAPAPEMLRVPPPLPPPRRPNLPSSHDVRISPSARSEDDGPSGGCGSDYWAIEGASLREVLPRLYGVSGGRIEWPAALDANTRYDFVLVLPHAVSL